MKKFTLLVLLSLPALLCLSQSGKLPIEPDSSSYQFKVKNQRAINLNKLSDGIHIFFSAEGNKLVLTMEKKKIINQKFFASSGKEIKEISGEQSVAKTSLCRIYTVVRLPDGTIVRTYVLVFCGDLNDLNKAVGSPGRTH